MFYINFRVQKKVAVGVLEGGGWKWGKGGQEMREREMKERGFRGTRLFCEICSRNHPSLYLPQIEGEAVKYKPDLQER